MSLARKSLLCLCCAALIGLAFLAPGQSPAASHSAYASGARASAIGKSVLKLLNRQRARRGLGRLRRSGKLDKAARWHSHDMVVRGYFDHQRTGGPSLAQRIRRSGYLRGARSWSVGENIAWGEGHYSTSRSLVDSWMASPGHRANILNRRFEHIGIGLVFGVPGRGSGDAVTITTDFGARG